MNPLLPLALIFIGIPIVEIYVLIKVGSLIGAIPTIALIVFSAVLGTLLVRHQGFQTLTRVRASLARGEVPAAAMLEGVALMIGGFLLLLPGFITDIIGLLLLVPPVRRALVTLFLRRSLVRVRPGGANRGGGGGPAQGGAPRTIEGEYRRED